MQPLISIIIPTFNRAHLIGETLDSVLAQTYQNWECIVVDDGSTDATDELLEFYIEKDKRIEFIKRKTLPKGASHCRNIGFDKARGGNCIFLDSDDLLLNFCLENRAEKIKDTPEMNFWVFPMFIKEVGKKQRKIEIPSKNTYIKDFLLYKLHWGVMCVLWKRDFIKSINGFNPSYPRLNDPEIHIRAIIAAQGNYKVLSTEKADCIYRVEPLSPVREIEFSKKYYRSLTLFIPDISGQLQKDGSEKYVPLLRAYLLDYLRKSYKHNSRIDNLKLLKIFFMNSVLTKKEYLKLKFDLNLLLVTDKLQAKQKRKIINSLKN